MRYLNVLDCLLTVLLHRLQRLEAGRLASSEQLSEALRA